MIDGGKENRACDRPLFKSFDVFEGLRSSAVVRRERERVDVVIAVSVSSVLGAWNAVTSDDEGDVSS
jgi:hypothetical protein